MNNEKKKSGVYKIINNINGKFYVGSAVNLKGRWNTHKSSLINNKHYNKFLQRSFNKHGYSAFSFIILEYCSFDKLIEREQYYIDNLNPIYNISKNAGNCLGVKHSGESNYKRGSWNRGKIGAKHNSSKPIYQYTLDGDFLKKWDSGMDIERFYNIDIGNIQSVLKKNKFATNCKFIWCKTFEGNKIEKMVYRDRKSTLKPIAMYDLNDNLVRVFASQKEAAELLGIARSSIGSCLTGKSETCFKHKWRYIQK